MTVLRATPLSLATGALRNHSVRAAMIFALSGAAFALGNLLLARGLSTVDYGKFALVVAILVVTSSIAPLGLDQILLRRDIRLTIRYLVPILLSATILAVTAGGVGLKLYGLTGIQAGVLVGATITLAVSRTVAAALRRHHFRTIANLTDTSSDWIILITGIATLSPAIGDGSDAALLFASGIVLTTSSAGAVLQRVERHMPQSAIAVDRGEAGSLLGIAAAGAVLVQAERLLIPLLLSLQDLAIFAVLTSVAIAPFRVLGSGIVTSLAQQMRVASDAAARRRVLVKEGWLLAVLTAGACAIVLVAGPWAATLLTGGRYQVSLALALTACVNGVGKVVQALPRAVIVGAGSSRDLRHANASIWLCVLFTVLGSLIGYKMGLTGVVLGAAIGNVIATVPLLAIARRLLR